MCNCSTLFGFGTRTDRAISIGRVAPGQALKFQQLHLHSGKLTNNSDVGSPAKTRGFRTPGTATTTSVGRAIFLTAIDDDEPAIHFDLNVTIM
jgi:hypothetical protein